MSGFELNGDGHGDRAGGRDRPIREQAIDRDNSGQDISHFVDGEGRRTVREERNCLGREDDGAVEFDCVCHRMRSRSFKDVEIRPLGCRDVRPDNTSSQSGDL